MSLGCEMSQNQNLNDDCFSPDPDNPGKSILTLDVTDEEHDLIKRAAHLNGMTVEEWVTKALVDYLDINED